MNLIQRVQNILLKPRNEWDAVASEQSTIASIYQNYLVILVAIPAIASFIGMSLIGVGFFGFSYRMPIVTGLISMVVQYLLSLGLVYVVALIVDALAPSFGGTKNALNAFKLTAYSFTAMYVGGIFHLIPVLGTLGTLVSLYSIYLFYTGVPVLMKCPEDKVVGYTVVSLVCGVVASVIVGVIAGLGTMGSMMAHGGLPQVSTDSSQGDIAAQLQHLAVQANHLEGGKPAVVSTPAPVAPAAAATPAATPALDDAHKRARFDISTMKALMPDTFAGLPRTSYTATRLGTDADSSVMTVAAFGDGKTKANVNITDTGVGAAMTHADGAVMDREDDKQVEKSVFEHGRWLTTGYNKDGSKSKFVVFLANGLMIAADGDNMDFDTLKKAVESLNLDKLEAMVRPVAS